MGLSYTPTPFHPTTVYPDQVTIELNLANQNFTTLAQIFMNNDPTTLQLKPSVGGNAYANPINLSSQTTDYLLEPGQVGVVSFSSQSLVPLNVAVPQPSSPLNPVMYELEVMVVSSTSYSIVPLLLYPNNTSYESYAFQDYWFALTGSSISVGASVSQTNCFYFATSMSNFGDGLPATYKIILWYAGATYMKQAKGMVGGTNGFAFHNITWWDTSTSWTSLGSIACGLSSSKTLINSTGFALVRRLS